MKKLLDFLKRNWFLFLLIILGAVFLPLTQISPLFLVASCCLFSIVSFYYARKLQLKYNKVFDEDPEDDYFDATKLDFDEEVYYIGSYAPKKKIKKSFFGKISTKSPSIALYLLGTALLALPLFTFLRALI